MGFIIIWKCGYRFQFFIFPIRKYGKYKKYRKYRKLNTKLNIKIIHKDNS